MAHLADRMREEMCEDCGDSVTVVEEPAHRRADNPHWAEAFVESDVNYQLCWKCGKVLWSPLEIGCAPQA